MKRTSSRIRSQVVQTLEDSQMKNVLRSVQPFCPNLSEDELRAVYAVIKNEHLERLSRSAAIYSMKNLRPLQKSENTLYEVRLEFERDTLITCSLVCFLILITNLQLLLCCSWMEKNFNELLKWKASPKLSSFEMDPCACSHYINERWVIIFMRKVV